MKKSVIPVLFCAAFFLSALPVKIRHIPATLDLRDNAKLSINFLTRSMDMNQNGVPYFTTYFGSDVSAFVHKVYDLDENPGRWLYGLFSARQVCGSVNGLSQENVLKDYLVSRMVHDNGLVYLPKYSLMCSVTGEDSAWMWGNRSDFMGLLCLYIENDDPTIRVHLEKAVNTLYKLAIPGDVGFYLNQDYYGYPNNPDFSKEPIIGQNMGGWITPLIEYYKWTGNKKAFELASGFADYIVKHHDSSSSVITPSAYGVVEGDFNVTSNKPGHKKRVLKIANTHGALFTIGGILRVAEIAHDTNQVKWAKKLVDYTIKHLATSFGWVPEHEDDRLLGPSETQSSEGCAVADLINCCIYLARNGYPEYWNLVERYTRNYLEEAQLKNSSWMNSTFGRKDNVHESYIKIPERAIGSYVGWGDPNDFVNPTARAKNSIQNCCGPHCAWATYLVWHNIVTKNNEGVYVNLLLNKRTPFCEVLSYLPYNGRVDVEMYVNSNLHLMIPDWVKKSEVVLKVNGAVANTEWDNAYLLVANLKKGDKITINYPMRIVTMADTIPGKGIYRTTWKGNTVVNIDPKGKIVPLFQRKYMLNNTCPTKEQLVLENGARAQIPMEDIDW